MEYGAKIISHNNQQKLKQQVQRNRQNETWLTTNSKPQDEPIQKNPRD
jgi:hypothetical protein